MTSPTFRTSRTIEGIARVVRVDGSLAWLEPEQTTGCGHCASAAACGTAANGASGIGTVARRIEARRFMLNNPSVSLREGERVVIGVDDRALLKGSLLAYALPLLLALAAGGIAQGAWGSDPLTMLGMAVGLGVGLLAARFAAHRLTVRGELALRFLRRALPGETCSTV